MNFQLVLATIGNIFLISALIIVCFSILSGIFSLKLSDSRLAQTSRRANVAVFAMIFGLFFILLYGFLSNDFSREFIYKNSSSDLPLFYKIAGPWGGLEGSLLLWAFILSLYTLIVTVKYRTRGDLQTTALIYLNVILGFILSLLVIWSNPLRTHFPLSTIGRGLNPLLQHPGMVAHPPLLYLGFIGFSVPFAFSLASLTLMKHQDDWNVITRRWTIVSWIFLSCGIIVGGLWAYEVLGWGGFWAWDPVENSSLLPWLAGTAYLHSSMSSEKTGSLKFWNYFLIILTFLLTMVGTFITRSGILNSVHAFSKSDLGGYFLIFIFISTIYSLFLIVRALPEKNAGLNIKSLFSREALILFNNLLFLVLILAIFYGNIYPLVSEGLLDKKISVQAPFFNSVSLPVFVLILLLMAVAPFISWRAGNVKKFIQAAIPATILGLISSIALYIWLISSLGFAVLNFACVFAFYFTILSFIKSYKSRKLAKRLISVSSSRRFGGLIVHLGVILIVIAIFGKYLSTDESVTLARNEKHQYGGYTLEYSGIRNWTEHNVLYTGTILTLSKAGQFVDDLLPAKAFYPAAEQTITQIDSYRNWYEDYYISLSEINNDGSITITIYLNRLVLFIPLSLILFIIGGLLTLLYNEPKRKDSSTNHAETQA